MPQYTYTCPVHSDFEVTRNMREVKATECCPVCEKQSTRNFQADLRGVVDIWYTDGAHKTDYGSSGHKQDRFAKEYERQTGEKAPAPDPNVPRNYKREREKGL